MCPCLVCTCLMPMRRQSALRSRQCVCLLATCSTLCGVFTIGSLSADEPSHKVRDTELALRHHSMTIFVIVSCPEYGIQIRIIGLPECTTVA